MIDAKSARTLVAESETLMEKYLEDMGNAIESLAQLGQSSFIPENNYTVNLKFRHIWAANRIKYRTTEFTPIQKLLQAKLTMLGYSMKFEKQEVRIGGGLGSMDDEVTYEDWDFIKISW